MSETPEVDLRVLDPSDSSVFPTASHPIGEVFTDEQGNRREVAPGQDAVVKLRDKEI